MAREARALGLDRADYVIRRRLVQKIEYLVAGTDAPGDPPAEAELRDWFEGHKDQYRQDEEITFTHVFVDAEKQHEGGNDAYARRLLASLNARGTAFEEATTFGDRFPYQQNYVGRSPRFIANQFGGEFAEDMTRLSPGKTWQGPLRSQFGHHLVLLTRRSDPGEPAFEEVLDPVLADVMEERRRDAHEALIDDLLDQYRVAYDGIPQPAPGAG